MIQSSFVRPPREIELQLLRHCESESQLLSPLTDYFALCGDHPAATVNIPLKHRSLLTRLRAMDYEDSSATRIDQLDELTSVVSQVFADFPGFGTELTQCEDCLAHVSLATSAAELAMVPFELAMMPPGTRGSAQRMCLQPHIPVCLTRRSRNVNRPTVNWRRPYRVLMISSDAGGAVPVQQHYALLRKLMDPWVNVSSPGQTTLQQSSLERWLTLKVDPTVDELQELLKRESFTHIHILAHGAACDEDGSQFGVALHSSETSDGVDIVDGRRLGGLLARPDQPDHTPMVVTLAVCNSGRQGGVVVPGSSLAFELHNAGVPLVVGSQFPLSMGGSVVMTKELYEGLLNGKDPRTVIWKTRCALFASAENVVRRQTQGVAWLPGMHDWASMLVFAEFPDDFDSFAPELERARIVSRLTPKMAFADSIARELTSSNSSGSSAPTAESNVNRLTSLQLDDLQEPKVEILRFRRWIENHCWEDEYNLRRSASKGLLASAQKRLGLVYLQIAAHAKVSTTGNGNVFESEDEAPPFIAELFRKIQEEGVKSLNSIEIHNEADLARALEQTGVGLLRDAKLSYDEVFRLTRSEAWALVQSLSLSVAAGNHLPKRSYETAWHLNDLDLSHPDDQRRTWALAAVAELILQSIVHHQLNEARGRKVRDVDVLRLQSDFRNAVAELARMAWQEPNEVRSALLQLKRFETDLIELAAMNSARQEPPVQSADAEEQNRQPWSHEMTQNFSQHYTTTDRRRMKSWVRGEDYVESEMFESDHDKPLWEVIRDLQKLVRDTVEPLFVDLDIQSYRTDNA